MAVRIRLRRIGKKKVPIYHIVAADSRAARNGKFIEVIGRYEPLQDPMLIGANEQRVFYWLRNGALPTDTVRSLFQRSGVWIKWTLTKQGAEPAKIAAEMEKWQMAQAEKRRHDRMVSSSSGNPAAVCGRPVHRRSAPLRVPGALRARRPLPPGPWRPSGWRRRGR